MNKGRLMTRCLTLLTFLLLASHALAHTKLAGSVPAAGATLAGPIREITLEFADAVRLTAVTLTDAGGDEKVLGTVPAEIAAKFVIAVSEPLASGAYVITWRAVGADTHVVTGEIPFSLAQAR